MDTIELKDILGTPFAIGDKVATDVTYYRSSRLRIGTVTAVEGRWVKVSYELDGRKQSVKRTPAGVVKVAA
ncbi:MAG: hypothetical protein GXC94_02145 [Comamonadaceae bacterium]|nr:hypothetical protein [Comamonadaceae bacterium]